MLFKENKKRERPDSEVKERRPAWQDNSMKALQVDIEGKAKLRKLKQTEKEKNVDGVAYQERLKEQYMKIIGQNDVFNWAT